jgi:hypothetical protein
VDFGFALRDVFYVTDAIRSSAVIDRRYKKRLDTARRLQD